MALNFNVHGYRFSVEGDEKAVAGLAEDFAFFAAESADCPTIELFRADPPLTNLPAGDALVYTPRNVAYRDGHTRYIDYHGRGLGILDEISGDFRLYCRDEDLLYEAAYLFLLSRIGEDLDRRGIHRVHALGVEVNGRAVLVLLPMGGGKSTLALHLLRFPEVRLLSDDSPWMDRDGRLLAFPLRLGLLPGSEETIPAEVRRKVQRMEFGPKYLVNYSYFADRVSASAKPGIVFIGSRTMRPESRIEQVGTLAGLRPMLANCVLGVGLFQGLEFLLGSGVLGLSKQFGVGISRCRRSWRLLRESQICRIHLGRDAEQNARAILDYTLSPR
ncbi:MAG: hypothetical protein ABSF22_10675 [Bryobacteraceae bacterium]|jgi:hypothetical protein